MTRKLPADWRETYDALGLDGASQALGVPRSTLHRRYVATTPPYVPRFEGYGHGAPAWKTAPGRAVSGRRATAPPDEGDDDALPTVYGIDDVPDLDAEARTGRNAAGPVRITRPDGTVEIVAAYARTDVRRIVAEGERRWRAKEGYNTPAAAEAVAAAKRREKILPTAADSRPTYRSRTTQAIDEKRGWTSVGRRDSVGFWDAIMTIGGPKGDADGWRAPTFPETWEHRPHAIDADPDAYWRTMMQARPHEPYSPTEAEDRWTAADVGQALSFDRQAGTRNRKWDGGE